MTQTQKLQLVVKWITSESDDSKTYALLHRKHDGLAVDCECRDQAKCGRKAEHGCKHMRRHIKQQFSLEVSAFKPSRTIFRFRCADPEDVTRP